MLSSWKALQLHSLRQGLVTQLRLIDVATLAYYKHSLILVQDMQMARAVHVSSKRPTLPSGCLVAKQATKKKSIRSGLMCCVCGWGLSKTHTHGWKWEWKVAFKQHEWNQPRKVRKKSIYVWIYFPHSLCKWKKDDAKANMAQEPRAKEGRYDEPPVPGMSAVHELCCWKAQRSGSPCQLLRSTVPRFLQWHLIIKKQ